MHFQSGCIPGNPSHSLTARRAVRIHIMHRFVMRECAFCPSTKLTLEHVWGDWINGIVPQVTYTTQRKISLVDFAEPWKTIGIRQTAKVVCRNCNNHWMSDLETKQAKPAMADMIRYGGAVSLLPKGIASISAWAQGIAIWVPSLIKLPSVRGRWRKM